MQKRTKSQRALDMIVINDMVVRQRPHPEIAAKLCEGKDYTITRQMVAKEVRKLEKTWADYVRRDVIEHKKEQVTALRVLEKELWVAWDKSKLDATRRTAERDDGGAGMGKKKAGTKQRVTTEGQCGDSSYPKLILDVQCRISKLLGLEEPQRLELSGPGGAAIQTEELAPAVISKERLRDIVTRLAFTENGSDLTISAEPGTNGHTDSAEPTNGAGA